MYICTSEEYAEEKKAFFRKHHGNFKTNTSGGSAEYYRKTFTFADGAVWYEVMQREETQHLVEINKCHVWVTADLFRVEFWNSDDPTSKNYYEPWKVK